MTMVATRMTEIQDLEEFAVAFLDENDTPVDPRTNGFPRFDFEKKMKGSATVNDWKTTRFAKVYPGKKCVVLYANGGEAPGQTSLNAVRKTYEEGEAEGGV